MRKEIKPHWLCGERGPEKKSPFLTLQNPRRVPTAVPQKDVLSSRGTRNNSLLVQIAICLAIPLLTAEGAPTLPWSKRCSEHPNGARGMWWCNDARD